MGAEGTRGLRAVARGSYLAEGQWDDVIRSADGWELNVDDGKSDVSLISGVHW